jgi:CPA2 family monovalent cation:H+ antiporter-2
MNHVEIIVCLLLLFMAVPDLCRKLGRPAFAYAAFIVFGLLLGPIVSPEVAVMLKGAGEIGFLLLLFEVGLEIDLPNWRDLVRPVRFALPWMLVQYPVVVLLAYVAGLDLVSSLVAAATLTGCSVGMAHVAWKHHPGLSDRERPFVLRVMVTLELLTVVLLAVGSPMLGEALRWTALLKLGGVVAVIYLAARFARNVMEVFETILQETTHWRTHLLVLLVLAICAVGERLGLSATKTAFFLGLFMSRVEHDGNGLEEFIAPISRRFLIPLFFVSLGMAVELRMLGSWNALLALGTAGLLLGIRQTMHRRWLRLCGDPEAFLLLCPNLTVVALGAAAMIEARKVSNENASWLLLTGFFMTVAAVALLPANASPKTVAVKPPPAQPNVNP